LWFEWDKTLLSLALYKTGVLFWIEAEKGFM